MTQRQLPLTDAKESQAERCRRILAGDVGNVGATARTFTATEAERAARLAASVPGVVLGSEMAGRPTTKKAAGPSGGPPGQCAAGTIDAQSHRRNIDRK